jgi:hypothetical protein
MPTTAIRNIYSDSDMKWRKQEEGVEMYDEDEYREPEYFTEDDKKKYDEGKYWKETPTQDEADAEEENKISEFYGTLKAFIDANQELLNTQDFKQNLDGNNTLIYKPMKKYQKWTMNINDQAGAFFIATMILNPERIKRRMTPNHLIKTRDLVVHAGGGTAEFIYAFKDEFNFLNLDVPTITRRVERRVVDENIFSNPTTMTDIYVRHPRYPTGELKQGSNAYKYYYGNIKLQHVIYDTLHNYKTLNYDVDKYCVISYMSVYLKKGEYKKIKTQLDENPTPTYIQLTEILNSINYNLNVYIIDGEEIQHQDTHKKTLNIMIHNEHMYVLTGHKTINPDKLDTVYVNSKKYDEIKSEIYTSDYKIYDGKKYKMVNEAFKKINNVFNYIKFFSFVNYEFFNSCNIRPPMYSDTHEHGCTLDINKAYYNILFNTRYVIPTQTGTEMTYIYDNQPINDIYFYYVEFKTYTHIIKRLFSTRKAWILGYLITNLNLDVHICYYHTTTPGVPENREEEKKNMSYIDIIHYTGYMASAEKQRETVYKSTGTEAQAIYTKYNNMRGGGVGKCKDGVRICDSNIKQSAGLYAYLGVMMYVRYELYKLYETLKIIYDDDIYISRIKTDSLSFNKKMTPEILYNINECLFKYGFSVKDEKGAKSKWNHRPAKVPAPVIYNYDKVIYKLNDALNANISFMMDAPAGVGKTHAIYNKVVPYLKNNNKTFEIWTTTNEQRDELNKKYNIPCEVVNNILQAKTSDINTLIKKYMNVHYIIIDEGGLLMEHAIKILNIIKNETKTNIIICGDKNQCGLSGINAMMSENIKILINNNVVRVKWTPKARYNKEYYDILNGLLKTDNTDIFNYVKKYFKVIRETSAPDENKICITWTHAKIDMLKKRGINALTIHATQGRTINQPYSIYEGRRLTKNILYTALSRATDINHITIYE